jgi:hypothetical protein
MFSIIVYDPEQLQWDPTVVSEALQAWLRDAGAFAAIALGIWLLAKLILMVADALSDRPAPPAAAKTASDWLFILALVGSFVSYVLFFYFVFTEGTLLETVPGVTGPGGKEVKMSFFRASQLNFLTVGGSLAILAAILPLLTNLGRLRFRRIWAIARLSIKETIRQRILWVFSALLLLVLFASWFIDSGKPELQLRNYIWVVDWAMTVLILLAASLLAAFSIPTDVKSQTIHTVVTKPVERFEIVLGRFLGYTLLMTVVLVIGTGLSLLYVTRELKVEAKRESYKARVPLYGFLGFKGTQGENVGREFTHRKYISGPNRYQPGVTHYALWGFFDLPPELAERKGGVPCEFSFDIFRTHKGEEGKGIFCRFRFVSWRAKWDKERMELRADEAERLKHFQEEPAQKEMTQAQLRDAIAEKFGIYEIRAEEVTDYHTQNIHLPAGLFKNIFSQEGGQERVTSGDEPEPLLQVVVNVTPASQAQLVGVAKQDLYLLDREKGFAVNYFKAAVGLWCRLVILTAMAVACSAYLSGIISWICAMFLFILGLFKTYLLSMALGFNEGGGPMEAMIKLSQHKPVGATVDQAPVTVWFDHGFRFFIGGVMKLLPDVNRFDLSRFVANGFDISWGSVVILDNLLRTVGYALPWLVLAYYLIKNREVANPT